MLTRSVVAFNLNTGFIDHVQFDKEDPRVVHLKLEHVMGQEETVRHHVYHSLRDHLKYDDIVWLKGDDNSTHYSYRLPIL